MADIIGGWGTKEGIRNRIKREPASGYVAPSHTGRTLAIAGGAAAVTGLGLFLKRGRPIKSLLTGKTEPMSFVDKVLESGARAERKLQHAAKLEAGAEKAAGKVAASSEKEFPEFHGKTHEETQAFLKDAFPEHEHAMTARRFLNEESEKFHRLMSSSPANARMLKGYKYYSEPYTATQKNPPKRGRYVSPQEFDLRVQKYYKKTERESEAAKIRAARARQTRERLEKDTNLERIRKGIIEFDISLKESRSANGKFASGNGMPPLSPRDMQYAYHTPIIESQKQQQASAPRKPSPLKTAALVGIGGAIGLGTLAVAAPALRKKILGQAVAETEAVGAKVAETKIGAGGQKIDRTTREGLTFAHNQRLAEVQKRLIDTHKAEMALKDAQHETEITTRTAHVTTQRDEAMRIARNMSAGMTAANLMRDKALAKMARTSAAEETYRGVVEGTLGPKHGPPKPLYGPRQEPLNPAARRQVAAKAKIVRDTKGVPITDFSGQLRMLRESLAGRPDVSPFGAPQRPSLGKIGSLQKRIDRLSQTIREGPSKGMTSYQVEQLKGDLYEHHELLKKHHDLLKRIDSGEIGHIEVAGHLVAAKAEEINATIGSEIRGQVRAAESAAGAQMKSRRKEQQRLAKLAKEGKLAQGHGVDYHAKAPKTKNPKHFSDIRLATRLSRATAKPVFEEITLRPGMIELARPVDDPNPPRRRWGKVAADAALGGVASAVGTAGLLYGASKVLGRKSPDLGRMLRTASGQHLRVFNPASTVPMMQSLPEASRIFGKQIRIVSSAEKMMSGGQFPTIGRIKEAFHKSGIGVKDPQDIAAFTKKWGRTPGETMEKSLGLLSGMAATGVGAGVGAAFSPGWRKRRKELSALHPGMIELGIGGEPVLGQEVLGGIEKFLANRRARLGKLNLTPRKKLTKATSMADLPAHERSFKWTKDMVPIRESQRVG